MKTTTSTKPTDEGALPKRDPKSGRFEKGTPRATKVVPDKPKKVTSTKPVAGTPKKA